MLIKIKNVFNKISRILTKNQKTLFWLVFVAAVISAVFETLSVSAIVPLVNALMTPEKLFEYKILSPFIFVFSIDTNKKMTFFVIIATILLYLIKNTYNIFFSWIKAKYASKFQRECSVYMMSSYMNRGYSYFLDKNPNEIFQGVVGDVQGVYNILNAILYSITKLLIVGLIGAYMMLSDWMLACSLVFASIICLIIIMFGFKRPLNRIGIEVRDYTIMANQILLQSIQGIKEVIVMRRQKNFIDLYSDYMLKRQKADIQRTVATDAPNSIVEAFCITSIMLILGVRITISDNPSAFIAILASFAVGAFRIMPSIGYISSSFNNIITNIPSLNAVYENVIEARGQNDQFNNVLVTDNEKYKNHVFNDVIQLKNLSFSYKPELGKVIDDLTMDIPKNKSVALVGESGAGKSTLADLILGILKADSGSIYLDGINIYEIPIFWSKIIGFVPQTIFLCDTSIAENVAFGEKKEDIDEDRVRKVLKMANVLNFIDSLPENIWTKVGDRGVRLSGGQRQRIGIARALYHNPEILILDEATSALDNDTERIVMDAIENLQGNMTMVIIAHRLSTIKNCDFIYEISQGKAQIRNYEELL